MFHTTWLSLLASLVLSLVFEYVRAAYWSSLRKIPGPVFARFSKFWRVGFVFSGQCPSKYQALHQRYGPIVRTGPGTVDISDPKVIPTIYGINSKFLKTKFYTTMTPPYTDGTLMPSMFSTIDPVYHKALKQSVASSFSMTSIRKFEPYVDQCSDIFISAMRARAGQKVDLSDWCQFYAFDVIGAITFQYRFGFMEQDRDVDGMIRKIWTVLTYAGIIGQVPEYHPWLVGNQNLMRLLKSLGVPDPNPFPRIIQIAEDRIKAYDDEEKTGDRGDFMAWLRNQEKNGVRMSQKDLVNHLSNNLAAGSDTTAISLRAIFYYLIKNPRCYKKQMDEIEHAERTGLLSEHVSYEECLKLPYLQAVMKEALRIHPGIGFPLERYVPKGGTNLCGIDLPTGTVVGVNPHVIHRDKTIYGGDAEDFRPERWIESDSEQLKMMDRYFLAFGAGARTCIGKHISIMEMGKLVPQVLRSFDLEWASNKPEWKTECFWMHKQSEMIVKFVPKSLSLLKG